MKLARILLLALLVSISSHAEVITYYDTHLSYQPGQGIFVEQHPTNGDYTGYLLYPCNAVDPFIYEPRSSSIYTQGTFLDEGCRVTYHGNESFQLAQSGGETYDIGYGDFNFEVTTAYGWDGEQNTVNGQGYLVMNNSPTQGLTMTRSVMTYEVIPEPSSAILMLVAGGGVWLFRRKLRR